jgi:predicted TIM-barrel fold metal-dependent hydrolase
MGFIDCHVHLYPPRISGDPAGWAAEHREPHFARLCTRRRSSGQAVQSFPTPDRMLAAMDEAGVERAVLLGWYWENHESCVLQNRFHADCIRAHPDRLSAFAAVNPAGGSGPALAEVRRAHGEGLIGLGELFPSAQGTPPGGPAFAQVLELAGELRMPVNLHATDPDGRPYPGMLPTPREDFLDMARKHPSTTLVLAHWGGMLPIRSPEALDLANLYYDTAASPLTCDPGIWSRFIGAVGARRVLFGSDYPLNLYPKDDTEPSWQRLLTEVRGSGLGEPDLSALLGDNARRMLGIF